MMTQFNSHCVSNHRQFTWLCNNESKQVNYVMHIAGIDTNGQIQFSFRVTVIAGFTGLVPCHHCLFTVTHWQIGYAQIKSTDIRSSNESLWFHLNTGHPNSSSKIDDMPIWGAGMAWHGRGNRTYLNPDMTRLIYAYIWTTMSRCIITMCSYSEMRYLGKI